MQKLTPCQAPFVTATLYSNSLLESPFTLTEHQHQFDTLLQACGISVDDPRAIDKLRDRERLPMDAFFAAVRTMGLEDSFTPTSGSWLAEDAMGYQESGKMAQNLLKAGVLCIIVGDVKDEVDL